MGSSKRIQVLLQPVGVVPEDTLKFLQITLAEQFENCTFGIAQQPIAIPSRAFDEGRNQFNSSLILDWLDKKAKHMLSSSYDKVLGICNLDAYSENFNFIFGEAQYQGRISAIYLPRLGQEFYGLSPNDPLFFQRAAKEAVHELGHSFGLAHCTLPSCVMYFSNSLSDTDEKGKEFCGRCKLALAS